MCQFINSNDVFANPAPVLRQIARYLPHHRSENASKTHPKSSHDKFKTASTKYKMNVRKQPIYTPEK